MSLWCAAAGSKKAAALEASGTKCGDTPRASLSLGCTPNPQGSYGSSDGVAHSRPCSAHGFGFVQPSSSPFEPGLKHRGASPSARNDLRPQEFGMPCRRYTLPNK
eukprot:1839297-Amphidinium_carterae.2